MKATLQTGLTLERGTLRARATLQCPSVQLVWDDDQLLGIAIEEGGVTVELAFPSAACVERFQRRIQRLPVPQEAP